ncbi:hypothetical protein [Vreelandella jeotgali]|uniref:hypothetical protein n=1 Tax=Vreelandella jeotgali TaxID=553386 RepID=UPI0012EA896F|nr:hypothetical protein [Halomonas jeotgali]
MATAGSLSGVCAFGNAPKQGTGNKAVRQRRRIRYGLRHSTTALNNNAKSAMKQCFTPPRPKTASTCADPDAYNKTKGYRLMFTTKHSVAALVGATTLAACAFTQAQAATWSDSFIGYRYGTEFTEPKNDKDVEKNILQFNYVGGHSLGQHFLNIDLLQSDSNDPASGDDTGATEAYVTYRNQLHYGKLFGDPLSFGPVKDVALTGGVDLNTKNTEFAPRKRQLLVGPTFKFDVPVGFMDFSVFYSHEWNHNGFKDGGSEVEFDDYTQFNLAWKFPFAAGPVPMKFQGFFNCRVPDDQMSDRSYPLLIARELLQQFIREQRHGHQAA